MTRRELALRSPLAAALTRALPARAADLKLSRYELFAVRVPFAERVREAWTRSWEHQKRDQRDYELTFVRLHSAGGLTGIGEAKMPRAQAEQKLKAMMGREPKDYLANDDLRGILIAVADLMGKSAGVPVARLLNPKARTKVQPTWWSQCFPPALMASEAKLGASLGYRIHKVKARPWEDPIAQAEAICGAIPKSMKVWADANATWATVDKTVEVARELAKFPNYFAIESPFARTNVDGYRALRKLRRDGKFPLMIAEHVDAMIVSGELETWTKEGLLDAWIAGAPKLGTYTKTLSDRAAAAKAPVWIEHSIDNGIAQVFQAHQVAAYEGLQYAIAISHVLADDCMAERFTVKDGWFEIGSKPGLGVSLDEAALDKYRIG
ncbi:MAG: mandelate racemase/muconate lactonizing enzyme family protein [Bryobacteraceae bacterium]